MVGKTRCAWSFCALMFAAAPQASAAVDYMEDWSAGDQNGWVQGTTSTTVVRDGSFGNPAGSVALRRILSDPIFDMGVTSNLADVSGDYTGSSMWEVKFDTYQSTGNFDEVKLRFRFQDATFNGWHLVVGGESSQTWENHAVVIDTTWTDVEAAANGWFDETGGTISWQQMMADVYHPEVRFIMGDQNSAIAYVDNFMLRAIPAPGAAALLCSLFGAMAVRRRR